MTPDEKIVMYKRVYKHVHGEEPVITKHGSWLKINGSFSNFRAKDLPEMAANLMTNSSLAGVRTNPEDNGKPWTRIGDDLIEMFLDRIYNFCGNSLFDMERFIKDAVLSSREIIMNDDHSDLLDRYEDAKEIIEEHENTIVEMKSHVESLSWRLQGMRKQLADHKSSAVERIDKYRNTIQEKNDYIERLKSNSILFSLEDLPDQGMGTPRKREKSNSDVWDVHDYGDDIDDEIPF